METVVIALGGNALLNKGEEPTFGVQSRNAAKAASALAPLLAQNKRFLITHGNGPQVGEELLRNKYALGHVPSLPMHILNAETQALIGSIFETALLEEFRKIGVSKRVSTVVTHVLVDKDDPGFKRPTKPVGPFYTKTQLERELKKEGFEYAKFGSEYRRVVASPKPLEILELEAIKQISQESIVICCGGGGIPILKGIGFHSGRAVIDKDLTSALLANSVGASGLLILTNVDSINDPKTGKPIRKATAKELRRRLEEFEEGTMRPKVEACIDFVGGKKERIAKVGNLFKVKEKQDKDFGTTIVA